MNLNQLTQLQQQFQCCVLHPQQAKDTAWVSASGRATPEIQIAIYGYAYRARLKEVLANDYPAVLLAVGDEMFDQLAVRYIDKYPSHFFSLRDFGMHMPAFIAELIRKDDDYTALPWLYELSLFEWSLGESFDASDASVFSEEDMADIPAESWAGMRFIFHPAVQYLDLEWNVPEIWQVLTAETPTAVTAMRATASPWLIWRQQLVTRYRSLQQDEYDALDVVRRGGDFNAACDVLSTLMEEAQVPLYAAGLLKGWITQGLISAVCLDE